LTYDTVWHRGPLLKVLKIFHCQKTIRLLSVFLGDRKIRVGLNSKISRVRTLNDGLPQGSVQAPALFNLDVSDLPTPTSFKLAYADDIALVAQGPDLKSVSNQLTGDLGILEEYLHKWKLCPNPNKTAICTHHLDNHTANAEVDVTICGMKVENVRYHKYLEVTFDWI